MPSLTIQLPHTTLSDTGLKRQWQLYSDLADTGQHPAVLDSRELLLNPEEVLCKLCAHLEIDFSNDMLSWEAGPRSEDGIWAPHWYRAVHRSRGFAPYQAKPDFPARLQALLDACTPWYEKLYEKALFATTEGE